MLERLDYEAVEAVEQQLDAFIERRARERADANRTEELWAISEARERERRREENREAWRSYHLLLAGNHAALCDGHRAKAEELAGARNGVETA